MLLIQFSIDLHLSHTFLSFVSCLLSSPFSRINGQTRFLSTLQYDLKRPSISSTVIKTSYTTTSKGSVGPSVEGTLVGWHRGGGDRGRLEPVICHSNLLIQQLHETDSLISLRQTIFYCYSLVIPYNCKRVI